MGGHDTLEHPSRVQTRAQSRVRRAGLGGRGRARGPWPVRPGVVPVDARPVQPARPVSDCSPVPGVGQQRVLARRRPVVVVRPRAIGTRQLAGVFAVTLAAVLALGTLGGVVAGWRAAEPATGSAAASVSTSASDQRVPVVAVGADAMSVEVTDELTVWDVAQRVAPAATGPEQAELAERIVADNGLTSVRVRPGQVLRIALG